MIPEHLKQYVDDKRIAVRTKSVAGREYAITCYTKEQFFAHDWDDVTKLHRGRIYRDGIAINYPFPKIFNVGEAEETQHEAITALLETEYYEVLDKVNGHLVIVSCDVDNGEVFVTTKGSFSGDLVEADEALIKEMGIYDIVKTTRSDMTFMFECLADYDKHLWYDEQLKKYSPAGANTMILLGAIHTPTGKSCDYERLRDFADLFNCPITERYEELEDGAIGDLYSHKGCEGYVLHFPGINFRFKVKTNEYVALRYLKELNADGIVTALYNSGIDNLYARYDEELYDVIEAVRLDFAEFVMADVIGEAVCFNTYYMERRDIAAVTTLTAAQKAWILKGRPDAGSFIGSKELRKAFKASSYRRHVDAAIAKYFDAALYKAA